MDSKFYDDFGLYCRALIGSKDVDPTYPVIKSIIEKEGVDPLWFAFVYVAFYNLETAILMCREIPTHEHWFDNKRLFFVRRRDKIWSKFGHERRGSARNVENQIKMFDAIARFLDTINDELEYLTAPEEIKNWHIDQYSFRTALQTLPNHGGWASFKIAEIFEKSFDFNNFTIPDLGVVGRDPNSNDGPVGGLRWLYGRDNKYDANWYEVWERFGARLAKSLNVDIGVVETCLCKWHKMVSGKYYIGHDIHEFHELEIVLGRKNYRSIMSDHFNPEIWVDFHGVQKQWKSTFSSKGEIVFSSFADGIPEIDVLDIILQEEK